MSIDSERLRRIEASVNGRFVPERGIVMVDMRDGLIDENVEIARLLELHKDVGIVKVVGGEGRDNWNPSERVQTVSLNGRSLESLIVGIQPDVLVATGYKEKNIDNKIPLPKLVNPMVTGDNTVGYVNRGLSMTEKEDGQEKRTAKERWLGLSGDNESFPGVRGLILNESDEVEAEKDHWLRQWLAESDLALAQVGFITGIITSLGGEHAETIRSVLNVGAMAIPVLGVLSVIGENKAASQWWKNFWRAGKKVSGSLASLAVGVKAGTMLTTVISMGEEMVGSIHHGEASLWEGYGMSHHEQTATLLSEPHHGEIVREIPISEKEPIMDWEHLPDYFHEQLGAKDWENSENGVNLSEVMTDHVLKNHGDLKVVKDVLDRMSETTSYNDYRLLRNAGQIY